MPIRRKGGKVSKGVQVSNQNNIPPSDMAIANETPLLYQIQLENSDLNKEEIELLEELNRIRNPIKKYKLKKKLKEIQMTLLLLNSVSLSIEIRQLTMNEYSSVFSAFHMLKQIIEKVDNKSIIPEQITLLERFPEVLVQFIDVRNPELIVDSDLISILKAKYIHSISNKEFKMLYDRLFEVDKQYRPARYEKYSKLKRFGRWLVFHIVEKRNLKKYNLDYLKKLVELIIQKELTKIIQSLSASEIIQITKQVLQYNDVSVKKNLQN